MDRRPQLFIDFDQFVDAGPTAIPRHVAFGAALGVINLNLVVTFDTQHFSLSGRGIRQLSAIGAQQSHQSLCHDGDQAR